MFSAIFARKAAAFAVGALLGAVATHIVLFATKSTQFGDDSSPRNSPISTGAKLLSMSTISTTAAATASPTMKAHPNSSNKLINLIGKVRLLCLIMTHPGNYPTKAVAVNNTWAPRCNRYVFVGSNRTELNLPLMLLNLTDVYTNLWQKTWMSLDAAENLFNLEDFDFVLKSDDDTYVVVENLRLLLAPLDPRQPVHLGRWFFYNRDPKQSYMSGGAGYVLSRAAVRLFLNRTVRAPSAPRACNLKEHAAEDWMMGTCLTSLGVKLVDSRDSGGLDRFHPINVEYMIGWGPAELPPWMRRINYYKFRTCLHKCISSVTATFHYTNNLYLMEFLLYGIRAFGVDPTQDELRDQQKIILK